MIMIIVMMIIVIVFVIGFRNQALWLASLLFLSYFRAIWINLTSYCNAANLFCQCYHLADWFKRSFHSLRYSQNGDRPRFKQINLLSSENDDAYTQRTAHTSRVLRTLFTSCVPTDRIRDARDNHLHSHHDKHGYVNRVRRNRTQRFR